MQQELESRSLAAVFFEPLYCGLVVLAGFFGNILTLYVVFRNPHLRTTPNMFVTSLALVDLLMGTTAIFLGELVLINSGWEYSRGTCLFQAFMTIFTVTTAMNTIVLTAVNRYYKIVKNHSYHRVFTKNRTFLMILGVWFGGLLVPVPLMHSNIIVFIPSKIICFVDVRTEWRVYLAVFLNIYIVCPVVVVSYCYLKIFRTVSNHQSNTSQSIQGRASNIQEIKITRMMFVIVLCFTICWTPCYVTNMFDCFKATFILPRAAYIIHSFAGASSSAMNPILYGLMNPIFRREYVKVLRCRKRRNNVCPNDQKRSVQVTRACPSVIGH